jgi:Mn-dependent DtxR family transcriptional regulator
LSELSRAKEHYLKVIYELSEHEEGARVSDIAEKLGVSKGCCSRNVSELGVLGLVRRDAERRVFLTPGGRSAVLPMVKYYDVIREHLITKHGIDKDSASELACALEHIITDNHAELMERVEGIKPIFSNP